MGALFKRVPLALSASLADEWAMANWWNWWGSWIFFGGPGGRWVVGTILGLRSLERNRSGTFPGQKIEEPGPVIWLMVAFAYLLALFATVCI